MDCRFLGEFDLSSIPPVPQIKVMFKVDANGILNVKAGVEGLVKAKKLTVTNDKGRLSQEDIGRMVREAYEFNEEDKKVKERIGSCTTFES